ncbi:MAG TPA: FliA/WhiG family RNA polymerase sigma factor [Terracidiphilus sp.]|jgi:RNA polymerase sigma factor for flagellar operon FliA|nr:FliA/WhiG family RNA polymerase sigma factor [Terracidiphilus sp.]
MAIVAATKGHTRTARRTADSKNSSHESARSPLTQEQIQMLLKYLPLVNFLARGIHRRIPHHISVEDLASAGTVGLIDAVTRFEPEKNPSFSQYAQFRIRGAILDSLRSLDWSPKRLRRRSRELQEAYQNLTARLGRSPDEDEMAAEMKLSLDAYQQLLSELDHLHVGSLHEPRSGDDSDEEEIAFVPANAEESPLLQCLRGELTDRLAKAIESLPEREKMVMTLYYYEEMSMREISLALNVTEGRISQMHARAILRLKVTLKEMAGSESTKKNKAALPRHFVPHLAARPNFAHRSASV